jgi:hypothetical protein
MAATPYRAHHAGEFGGFDEQAATNLDGGQLAPANPQPNNVRPDAQGISGGAG